MLRTLRHLGEAQDKLLKMNYRMEKVQLLPCISGKTEHKDEKQTVGDAQMLPCISQTDDEPSSTHEEQNRDQLMEGKAVEIDTVASLNEQISGPDQKYPSFTENEAERKPEESIMVPNEDNRKVTHAVRSSSKKPSESIDLEAIPGDNEKDITACRKLENIPVQPLGRLPNLEKQGDNTEAPKQGGSGKRRRKVKRSKEKGVHLRNKSNKTGQSNQEGEFVSTGLEYIDPTNASNLVTGKSGEEDAQSDWMTKEFLVEVNGITEPEVACFITAPCAILENLIIRTVNDVSSLVVDDAEELISNIISVELLPDGQTVIPSITIVIPFNSRYRGMYKEIMVKLTDMNFQSNYLTPSSLEGHQGNHKGTFAEIKGDPAWYLFL
uniref:Uncharacterized protein n=1 Tax=Sphaerodactylus townsendi TaxID=933632 RepID=A0ACB8E6J4_9SAUR